MAKALILAALLALACCTTTRGSFCAINSPIRLSEKSVQNLTDDEVNQVLALNEKGAKLCGWRP